MTDGPPSNRESRDEPSRRGSSSGKFDDGRRDLLGGTGDQSRFGGLSTVETHSADPNQADRLLWQFDDDTKFVSSPTIVGGTLFIGGTNARVYALDANNGTEVWEYNPGICIGCSNRSSPNVVNGTVYYGTWNGDGAVRGLDAATGEQEWYYSTTDDDVTASSLVYEGTVYSVDESGFIYAVDAESSEELWSIQIDTDPDMSPVVADGRIYMTERIDSTAGLSAFDASTGDRMWHRSNDGGEFRRVTVADGVLYASGYDGLNGELYAMDPADGDILGIGGFASNFSAVYRPPTVANGMLYVGGQYAREGILVAVDRDTLNYAWSFNPDEGDDDDPFHQESAPTVADGIVYMMAGKYDGTDWQSYLYAIDAVTGDEQWRYQLETQTGSTGFGYSSPTVVDGAVYIATHTNGVLALDADGTGTSEDSRVTLGTLGHHDGWTGSDPPESVSAEIDVSTGVVYPGETVTFDASNS